MEPSRPHLLPHRELGAGDPVVLINGYAAAKDDWDPAFLDGLSRRCRLICLDNRGMGESPPVAEQLTIGDMANDVIELIDALDLEQPDVIGWSMGGFITQELAARVPDRIGRIALLSTDPGGPDAIPAAAETWARLINHGGTPREQASRIISLLFPPGVSDAIDAQFGEVVAQARAALSTSTLVAQERAIESWHSAPSGGRLAAIGAPALIAAGELDVVIPPANSDLLATALPGARRELFAGSGHGFMAQQPERLSGLINDWLKR